jgi:hypothetical protein
MVIGVLFIALVLVGSFTHLPSIIGLFVWWVILPVVIAGVCWSLVFFLEAKQQLRKGIQREKN